MIPSYAFMACSRFSYKSIWNVVDKQRWTLFLSILLLWIAPNGLRAQPLTCPQCVSSDIKYTRFYIADPAGGPLSNTCTPGTSVAANVCVDFDVTANKRYGFYFAVQYTVNSTPYSFTQCYSETLNQGPFTKCFPITYNCGDDVVLSSVLIAWGNNQNDLTTFCQPANLNCGAFNPKCFSDGTDLPPVQSPLIGDFTYTAACQGTNPFQTFTFSGTATSGGTGPYTFDWDLDGNGTFETLNQSTPSFTYTSTTPVNVTMRVTDSSNPVKIDQQVYSITPAACPLPVTLSRFDAKSENNKAVLTWETAQEKDNDYFLIEYSLDAKSFEAIGRVEGNKTTTTSRDYSFVHTTPVVGVNYYRLRQTDTDGRFTRSAIRSVIVRTNGELVINQNPVSDLLSISGVEKASTVQIVDLKGNSLYQTVAEANQLKIPIPRSWANGLYLLRVIDLHERVTFRFIVQK